MLKEKIMDEMKIMPDFKQAVLDLLKLKPEPGYLITNDWLNEHFNLSKPEGMVTPKEYEKYQFQFMSAMANFKETLLEEHKIAIRNIPRTGSYEVVAPQEQTKVAMENFYKETKKTFRSATSMLANLDARQLTREQVQENTEAQMKVSMIAGMTKRSKKLFAEQLKALEVK